MEEAPLGHWLQDEEPPVEKVLAGHWLQDEELGPL